jgi:hypothetical protein
MRSRWASLCIVPIFFIVALNISAQPINPEIDQTGVAVRILREASRLECIDDIKSFERLLAISADQVGYGIFGNQSNAHPHEGLVEISINSFLGDERMHSALVVAPIPTGCNLLGQRATILQGACKDVLNKRPRFKGASYVVDQSGAMVLRDENNVNRGFMIEGGGACAYIEVLSRVKTADFPSVKSPDRAMCTQAVRDFKVRLVNSGVDYPVLSRSKNANAGLVTQKGVTGAETIFYASSLNSKGVCEIAAQRIQLFPRDCVSQKELIPELKALKIKARSKGGSILLDMAGNAELEMSDVAPNACLVSINRVDFQ